MSVQSRIIAVVTMSGSDVQDRTDLVALEEPLEIRVQVPDSPPVSLAITMRTPGNDEELAVGFLWSEGILTDAKNIIGIQSGGGLQPGGFRNLVTVDLAGDFLPDFEQSARRFYLTSSCGVCGKGSLEAIEATRQFSLDRNVPLLLPQTLHSLPETLRAAQATFEQTGGLHAAGLFDSQGVLHNLREDVGRHNAVDKLIGTAIRVGSLPLSAFVLLVSGRASYELVQKAAMAGIPVLVSVGAPSSLAVALARETGMTLVGFLRGTRFNIYAGEERITRQ